jgi:mannose-6-phosphate isomerase-like protein (cupin superfamily)
MLGVIRAPGNRFLTRLIRTDIMIGQVQLMRHGGEERLHSHAHLDGLWMVLNGRCRFYGEGDALLADLGKHEGVLIPRGFKYWFESVGDEELELLQVEAFDVPMKDDKTLFKDITFDRSSADQSLFVEDNAAPPETSG